jgi:hypothetical protein
MVYWGCRSEPLFQCGAINLHGVTAITFPHGTSSHSASSPCFANRMLEPNSIAGFGKWAGPGRPACNCRAPFTNSHVAFEAFSGNLLLDFRDKKKKKDKLKINFKFYSFYNI